MSAIMFSVIIPTYMRDEELIECLESLERQTFPHDRFEVIIADDAEHEAPPPTLEGYMVHTSLAISICYSQRGGPGAARNQAAAQAKGQILAFTEDDVVLDSHWLERAAKHFEMLLVGAVEGRTMLKGSSEEIRTFESSRRYSFIPCNFFVRREVFNTVGGYDTNFFDPIHRIYFREDADFGFRLLGKGVKITIANDVVASHPPLFSDVPDYFRHARRYFFDSLLHRKHPGLYRSLIEVKDMAGMTVHRPFHYASLIFCVTLPVTVLLGVAGVWYFTILFAVLALASHVVLRRRYERKAVPQFWNLKRTLAFVWLPFYYVYWFAQGCKRFQHWGALI